jgi:hypothetical protein
MAKPARKNWAILLFSLPFAGIGIGFLVLSIIPTLYEWQQMSSWSETQATVTSAELQTHQGDDSTTYEATGTYQYQVGGNNYTGSQLGISTGADNIGEWHENMDKALRHSLHNKFPISIYYNPDNPADAIVDRNPRWGLLGFKMIFVLAFGGSGIGLMWWSIKNQNRVIDIPEAGDKPWLGHKDWASATILSDAKAKQYVVWGVTLIWNLISAPLLFAIPKELDKGNNAFFITAVFPLIGAALLVWAIKTTRRWLNVGATPLTLDPYPGSIGGQVGGSIQTNIHYRGANEFPITLSCLYSYVSGSGKNRSRKESLKWQAQGFARAEPAGRGSRLQFRFDLPTGLPESQSKDEQYHFWRLNLKSEGLSVDIDRNFELPVFSTAISSRDIRVDSTSHPLAQEKRDEQIESVMQMRQIPGGLELFFPRGRNAGVKLGMIAFGLIFFTAGMGAGALGAPLIFPILFGLIGGGVVFGGLYSLLNSLSVRIGRDGIHSQRKLLGVNIGQHTARAADIRKLRIHKGGSMSSGTEHKVFFSIKAHLIGGGKITVAESLIGQQAAQQAAEAIGTFSGFDCDTKIVDQGQEFADRKKAYLARKKRS